MLTCGSHPKIPNPLSRLVLSGLYVWSLAAKSRQSCPILCDPIDGCPQAALSLGCSRQEPWSGLPFPPPAHSCTPSRFSRVQLCATPWTAALQAPLSTGFSRQEHWSGLPLESWGIHVGHRRVSALIRVHGPGRTRGRCPAVAVHRSECSDGENGGSREEEMAARRRGEEEAKVCRQSEQLV